MKFLFEPKRIQQSLMLLAFGFIQLQSHAQFTANAGKDALLCKGDTALLGGTPIASGGMTPYNYTWTPNYNLSNPNTAYPNAWPDSTITYHLSVGDGNGRSAIDSIQITVVQKPVVTFDSIPDQCTAFSELLLTQGQPSGGFYLGPGIDDSLRFNPKVGIGNYKLTYHYKDQNCNYADSASQNVSVYRSPVVRAHPIPDSVCMGDSVRLSATGAENYSWAGDPTIQLVKGDSVAVFYPDTSALIGLGGTNYPYCKDSIQLFIKVVDCSVGIHEPSNKFQTLLMKPNPVKDYLYIQWENQMAGNVVEVIDLQGVLIDSFTLPKSVIAHRLQVSEYPAGVYFIRLKQTGIVTRFVKVD